MFQLTDYCYVCCVCHGVRFFSDGKSLECVLGDEGSLRNYGNLDRFCCWSDWSVFSWG